MWFSVHFSSKDEKGGWFGAGGKINKGLIMGARFGKCIFLCFYFSITSGI